jgi:hypothetical protein
MTDPASRPPCDLAREARFSLLAGTPGLYHVGVSAFLIGYLPLSSVWADDTDLQRAHRTAAEQQSLILHP